MFFPLKHKAVLRRRLVTVCTRVLDSSSLAKLNFLVTNLNYINVLADFPGLSNINGRAEAATATSIEVSFLKWTQRMIGDTPPDTYVFVCSCIYQE